MKIQLKLNWKAIISILVIASFVYVASIKKTVEARIFDKIELKASD